MIEIDVDESAEAMVEILKEHMENDGIWEYAKEHLYSVVTGMTMTYLLQLIIELAHH